MNEIEKAQQEIGEARERLASAEARLSALSKPVEREYRAGEWVPVTGSTYYYKDSDGRIFPSRDEKDKIDSGRLKSGNMYPSMHIAEAAKAHADWWREFDLADEGGEWIIFAAGGNMLQVDKVNYMLNKYGMSHFESKENADVAVKRLGGKQKVAEMLNNGRVFRFKWGGQ